MGTDADKEIERLLNEAGVWQLSAYGWLNANDADPKFIGHAMWQTDPPVGDARFIWTHNAREGEPPPPLPTERQQMASVAGVDFEGLMSWARLSIGMMLVEAEKTRANEFVDDTRLELHRASATIYLSTASDRLHDLILAAAFGFSQKAYKADRKRRGLQGRGAYVEAFEEAAAAFAQHSSTGETCDKLVPLAEAVAEMRKSRNALIHELATDTARRERASLKEPPRQADRHIDFAAMQESIKQIRRARNARLDQIVGELSEWYRLLAKLSSEVFYVENRMRP